jgi:hypothetical protein
MALAKQYDKWYPQGLPHLEWFRRFVGVWAVPLSIDVEEGKTNGHQ